MRFAFILVAGCLSALWSLEPIAAAEHSPDDEAKAVESLRPLATNIQFHDDGTVQLVRLSKPHVDDKTLSLLTGLKNIEYLAVVAPKVTDAGLVHLTQLSKLHALILSETALTDEGLTALSDLKQLERLYLDQSSLNGTGLRYLAELDGLRVLSLRQTNITDAGLESLVPLEQLEALFLDESDVTDEGLVSLGGLSKLQTLHLNGTKITGAGLKHLAALTGLKHLNLNGTRVDAEHLDSIAQLKTVERLTLFDTPLDSRLLTVLRQRMPSTELFGSEETVTGTRAGSAATAVPAEASADIVQAGSLQPILPPARERFATLSGDEIPDFQRHVLPLLGRLGCNGRACHGSFQGQGGFRLSMFGYDFAADHAALAGSEAARVDLESPAESLVVNKPTSEDEHGGGRRFAPGGWEQTLLQRWIAGGAPPRPADPPEFVRLEVTPREIVFQGGDEAVPLQAVAIWSDGWREDVTCLCRFETKDDAVAEVTADGIVQARGAGDTHVIVFYDNGITPVPVLRPVTDVTGERYPAVPTPTRIDELVVEKLAKLGIVPSELCTDDEFLRRVSLDIIGTLPTPAEIEAFVADPSPDKRRRKIDELLERPAYVTWWTLRLCDLTGGSAGLLGGTEMASRVAEQWKEWVRRRVEENTAYDKIVEGIVLASSRRSGQTYEEYIAEQSSYTRMQDPADYAAEGMPMPHYWYRDNITAPKDKALSFGYIFLGVRLECAECHKHPYDQWSQQDFQRFTEFFTRIKTGVAPDAREANERMREMLAVPKILNTAALRRQSYLRIAAEGRAIPWNEVYIEPPPAEPQPARLLGGAELDLADYRDPREPLMRWLEREDNPYFARAFVNRIWANYFNVGIINPTDDLNLANPPSNERLLDYLIEQFIASGYDMKWLHRHIANSRTYQLSWRANETNRGDTRNFSRAVLRRLPAEVVIDAIHQATANDTRMAAVDTSMQGRKIGDHPRSYQARTLDYSLLVFGKPLRTTNCDCERQDQPTLLQALYIRNDQEVFANLDRKDGWLQQLRSEHVEADQAPDRLEDLVQSAYLRTLSRPPTPEERTTAYQHIKESTDVHEGMRDLMWALLNSDEFITNH